jgi:hypothetical protein
MMYLVVIHEGNGPTPYSAERVRLSDDEQHEINEAYRAITEIPGVSPAVQLETARTATSAPVGNGASPSTDGSLVAEEALRGYVLFEADGFDAATELASRLPVARMGGAVEVRPVVELSSQLRTEPGARSTGT